MDSQQQHRMEALLSTMSLRSPKERTQLLERIAREDPEMAAQLSLRISNAAEGADPLATLPLTNLGLPGRFRVTRCLGRGGFGTVYEAYDCERGHPVAVKILREPHADALFRFKQEFRALANLKHPNLIEFYDLFEHGQLWFFTMELVSGLTFLRHVRGGNECDLGRLRPALRDLTRVLAWLHRHKLLHRDIKPDNVLIDRSGRLVLLDFGLARHLTATAASGTISAGTPAYMAPEQISNAPVTESADWYAVGAMLYEALTGELPFRGTMMEVLAAKISSDPAPPSSVSPAVPSAWSELCLRLLRREPDSRPGAPELLEWFGDDAESTMREQLVPDFFGREDDLHQLLAACDSASAGIATVVELTGPSGFGKSRIVQAFADVIPHRYPEALVIRGRCYEHESLPFKALDSMMDDLSRQLRPLGSALGSLLPAGIATLARLFPVLERVDCITQAVKRNPVRIVNVTELRRQAFHAFASLLEAICSQRLVVICLDDLQWGDSDSAALFQHLFSRESIPPFVLAATYRAEEPPPEFIRLWREHVSTVKDRIRHTILTIGPLEQQAVVDLARSLLARNGMRNEEIASTLASESGGNPLLLEQLAADFVRSPKAGGLLRSVSVGELVRDRISRFSSATRDFLQVLAAFGEPLPESLVIRLLPGHAAGLRAMPSLISQNLVRRRLKSGIYEIEIQHDQIRGAILDTVPEPERRAVHLQIAEALVSIGHADPGMIAIQFTRGGDSARGAEYAVTAGAAAESVLAFDRAAQFYSIALALGEFDRERISSLYERLARAHASAGRGSAAALAYMNAAESADSPETAADMRRHAGEHWIRSGNVREGVRVLASLGAEFNVRHTDSILRAIASILWSRALLRARGFTYEERQGEEVPARDLARLDVCWALTAGLSLWNPVIGTSYQLKHLRLALDIGEPRRVALALASEASYSALAGERAYPRARSLLGEALAIGTRLKDSQIIGTANAMDAMCAWLTGRWNLARDRGEEAERILRENCAGVSWELGVARNACLGGLLWGGQWKEYAARLNEFSRDAQDRGDLNSLAIYRMNRCPMSLAQDHAEQAYRDLDEAERILASAWSGHGFHIPHFFGLFGRAQVALYSGDRAAALDILTRGLRKVRRSFLLRIEAITVFALLLEATLEVASAAGLAVHSNRSVDLLRRARRCAEAIRRRPAIWGSGIAMLIEAGAEAAEGRMHTACARWLDAERELNRAGMLMYAAAARYWRGRVSADPELLASAEAFLREQGIVSPTRIAAMLAPGFSKVE